MYGISSFRAPRRVYVWSFTFSLRDSSPGRTYEVFLSVSAIRHLGVRTKRHLKVSISHFVPRASVGRVTVVVVPLRQGSSYNATVYHVRASAHT